MALDARDLIEIDYEPLPAVVDPEEALAPDAPVLYEDFGSNLAFSTQVSSILVQSGVATNGQGHYTTFAQIAAAVFAVPDSQVEVQMNDSALPAFGIGTFGSRTAQIAGTAVYLAAEAAREKVLSLAALQLEAAPPDLDVANGQVSVHGVPTRAISLGQLATIVEEQPELIEHEKPNPVNDAMIEGLAAWRDFSPTNATVNAALDALAPLGIRVLDMPLKPERIWAKIAAARAGNPPEADPLPPALLRTCKANQEGGTSTFA